MNKVITEKKKQAKQKTGKLNKEAARVLRTMDWSSQSPDLNISECFCYYLDHEKQKIQPTSKTELVEKISQQISTLLKRMEAVIKANCGHIKY